jgi:hypothetical protein
MDVRTFLERNPDAFKPLGRAEVSSDGKTYVVSTIVFGINRLYGLDWLAETVTFDPCGCPGDPCRYSNERDALDGHAAHVAALAAALTDPVIVDVLAEDGTG